MEFNLENVPEEVLNKHASHRKQGMQEEDEHEDIEFHSDAKDYYNAQYVEYISVDLLNAREEQPRKSFDEESLKDLAQSIRTYGILQPIVVSVDSQGTIFIIAGERRFRAAQLAGLKTVPCIVRDLEEHSNLELALIENIQREELSPVDEARAYVQLMDDHQYTQEELSSRLGKSRSVISNAIRILALPKDILEDLDKKAISMGHARALCGLSSEKQQIKIHKTILLRKLSVRQTEDLIKGVRKEKSDHQLIDNISADLRYVCDQFKGHLGTKVRIAGDGESGRIEISYYTTDDLHRISELILGNSVLNVVLKQS
jgi:ParB family chromosome partitioning protein